MNRVDCIAQSETEAMVCPSQNGPWQIDFLDRNPELGLVIFDSAKRKNKSRQKQAVKSERGCSVMGFLFLFMDYTELKVISDPEFEFP